MLGCLLLQYTVSLHLRFAMLNALSISSVLTELIIESRKRLSIAARSTEKCREVFPRGNEKILARGAKIPFPPAGAQDGEQERSRGEHTAGA